MSKNLQVLADNQDALLLAEGAGLLHDWQKCIDMAVASKWRNNPQLASKAQQWQQRGNTLRPENFSQTLARFSLSDDNSQIDMKTLCEEGKNPTSARNHSHSLVRLLGSCHDFAHVEKELEENEQREQACDKISDAFGFEYLEPKGLLKPLLTQVKPHLQDTGYFGNREPFLSDLKDVFSQAWGDTRRPINEVTLWDWSYAVASLYKSELAYHFLTGEWRDRNDLRWRLLRVNFDMLGLYAKAVKIADLLAYQDMVNRACAAVKHLVEYEYPLGNEVYRDTTGIYFTYPDLELFPELAQKIRQRVESVGLELTPRIAVEQSSRATAVEQLKRLLADARDKARQDLAQPFAPENLRPHWAALWEKLPQGQWEVCPVCRLRPMKEKAKSKSCKTCRGRRESRIKAWLANPQTTIWMDEIADAHGRVALIVGKFGLDDWLSGDLVQTLLVKCDPAKNVFVPKNSSPARLRRVWETCQRFWMETVKGTEKVKGILQQHKYGNTSRCSRLIVIPDNKTDWQESVPYDGTLNGQAISLLWREQAKHFITISNLEWLNGSIEEGQEIVVRKPNEPNRFRRFEVQGVMPALGAMGQYTPTLTLLESPDQFLALIPAAAAPEILAQIRDEYLKQFGKVQNRLPLFLGAVFFPRKTPLAAVMDAGRRMANVPMADGEWRIAKTSKNAGKDITLNLENDKGERIQYTVPIVMGDGKTPDAWYPYFKLAGIPKTHHTRRFEHAGQWWVHVEDLRESDAVYVTPSRFAYLFLESTAQRFRFDPAKDVHYLDELPRLAKMWKTLRETPKMTNTKLQGIWALFQSKWEQWRLDDEKAADYAERRKTFKQLVQTTFAREKIAGITEIEVLNGTFDHCLELYLHILKQSLKEARNE